MLFITKIIFKKFQAIKKIEFKLNSLTSNECISFQDILFPEKSLLWLKYHEKY